VAREYTSDKATDFSAILTTIKGKNPDVLFFGGMDPQGAPMAKQMQSLGLKAKFLGGDGLQTAEFLKLAGAAAEGVTASSPGLPSTACRVARRSATSSPQVRANSDLCALCV